MRPTTHKVRVMHVRLRHFLTPENQIPGSETAAQQARRWTRERRQGNDTIRKGGVILMKVHETRLRGAAGHVGHGEVGLDGGVDGRRGVVIQLVCVHHVALAAVAQALQRRAHCRVQTFRGTAMYGPRSALVPKGV